VDIIHPKINFNAIIPLVVKEVEMKVYPLPQCGSIKSKGANGRATALIGFNDDLSSVVNIKLGLGKNDDIRIAEELGCVATGGQAVQFKTQLNIQAGHG
jgi:hypothetical protein